jgi:octaprenyl-diphosphate synthase
MGKNVGDDLAEGKPTLPLIHAIHHCEPDDAALLRTALEQGGTARIDAVLEVLHRAGAIDYARGRARDEADAARAALARVPAGPCRDALDAIADQAVDRSA